MPTNEKEEILEEPAENLPSSHDTVTFTPPDHPLLKTPAVGSILSILPTEIWVAGIATKLDLPSLFAFICVCKTTYKCLNSEVAVWKSMLRNMGVDPELGKLDDQQVPGAFYKSQCHLFHSENLSLYHFIIDVLPEKLVEKTFININKIKLMFKDSITLTETARLHKAILDAHCALVTFSENPQLFFKSYVDVKITIQVLLPRLYLCSKHYPDLIRRLLSILLDQYSPIDISSENKLLIGKFISQFLNFSEKLSRFPVSYIAISRNFGELDAFVNSSLASNIEMPISVDYDKFIGEQVLLAIYKGVEIVDPLAAQWLETGQWFDEFDGKEDVDPHLMKALVVVSQISEGSLQPAIPAASK